MTAKLWGWVPDFHFHVDQDAGCCEEFFRDRACGLVFIPGLGRHGSPHQSSGDFPDRARKGPSKQSLSLPTTRAN